MQLPLQITFRQMETSPDMEAMVRQRAAKLDTFAEHIMSCRVVIEPAGKHRVHGNQHVVRINITVPGGEIAATREPAERKEYKDVSIAIRDAFNSAARQLEDYVRNRREARKESGHVQTAHARVSKLMPAGDYGFLETPEGREVYFHRNSVLNDAFDQLAVGSEVAFAEEEGDRGPQASTVKLAGRHGGVGQARQPG
jgi:cold shock CspA family protein/ribosome-associated translation inhibitor RaiA